MYFSIRNQFCPNSECRFFKKPEAGNILIHGREKKRFRCKICKKTWVEGRNSSFFGLRSPQEKIERAIALLRQGKSIRRTAAHIRASPTTIARWKSKFIIY